MSYWFTTTYDHVDAMNMEGFLAGLTPDVEVIFGNNPPLQGHAAVRAGIGGFWQAIDGLTHHFENVLESGPITVMESKVEYRRKDDRSVKIPCVTVLERSGDQIRSLRVYSDMGPVFA
jgi:ketosteroid isomerase-like protein